MKLRHFRFPFHHPVSIEPTWAAKVDRWYQLDPYAYGLAESYTKLGKALGPLPEHLLLASPDASNRTDLEFARSGASSPTKFAHTLPNIRGAAFYQVSGWTGPMFCFQRDPYTIGHAIGEATRLTTGARPAWVVSVVDRSATEFCVHWFVVGGDEPPSARWELVSSLTGPGAGVMDSAQSDPYLLRELENAAQGDSPRAEIALPGHFAIRARETQR